MQIKFKNIFIHLSSLISGFFFYAIKNIYAAEPKLQIDIPNLHFSPEKGKWIGEYISAIYNYALSIGGILVAVIIMFGGVIWLTAGGNQSKVEEAKEWIKAAITGLILLMTSYVILNLVNPDLVALKSLDIEDVKSGESSTQYTTYDSYQNANTKTQILQNKTVLHYNSGKPANKDNSYTSINNSNNNYIKIIKPKCTGSALNSKSIEGNMASRLAKFIQETEKRGYNIRVTSLNDGQHDGGTHPLGRGADIGGLTPEQATAMGEWWINQDAGRRYIDNYNDGHLHIDLGYPPN